MRTPAPSIGLRALIRRRLSAFFREDRGQVLPISAIMLVGFLGMAAVSVDMGHAMLNYEQLQNAADAAALAGAQALPNTTASTVATQYSAVASQYNAQSDTAGTTMAAGYPKLLCLTTIKNQGAACSAPANANAVQVRLQMSTHLNFAGLFTFGHPNMTVTATSTAAPQGAAATPYNVAIIVDTTLSMAEADDDCSMTQLACALNGVQVLLNELAPCASGLTQCSITNGQSANVVDSVALFTFPNVTVGTVSIDSNCTTPIPSQWQTGTNSRGQPTYTSAYLSSSWGYYTVQGQPPYPGVSSATGYTYPSATATSYSPSGSNTGTYQITGFMSDYKTTPTVGAPLNTNSTLVKAAGGASSTGCNGLGIPNYDGDYGTYYAGVIYAAQAALTAQKAANPGTQNAIILLSDGNATAPDPQNSPGGSSYPAMPSPANGGGVYPSYANECSQGIVAAKAAAAAGTRVYTVAYGSPTSGCASDTSGTYAGITPCQTMEDMASAPQYFFSDWKQSNSNSTCYSQSQPVTSLSDIFKQISAGLTKAMLIPNNTT